VNITNHRVSSNMHVLFMSVRMYTVRVITDSKLVHGLIESPQIAVVFGSLHVVLAECSHSEQQR